MRIGEVGFRRPGLVSNFRQHDQWAGGAAAYMHGGSVKVVVRSPNATNYRDGACVTGTGSADAKMDKRGDYILFGFRYVRSYSGERSGVGQLRLDPAETAPVLFDTFRFLIIMRSISNIYVIVNGILQFSPEVLCKTLYDEVERPWKHGVDSIVSFPQRTSGVYHNERFVEQIEGEDDVVVDLLLKKYLSAEDPEDLSQEWDRNKRHFHSGAMIAQDLIRLNLWSISCRDAARYQSKYGLLLCIVPTAPMHLLIFHGTLLCARCPKHVPICEIQFNIVKLTNYVYEYRPSYYEEISCVHKEHEMDVKNQFCSAIGLSCVTRNKTIHFARRKYESDCWEPKTMVIPAGCECMWPVHMLGTLNFEPHISL